MAKTPIWILIIRGIGANRNLARCGVSCSHYYEYVSREGQIVEILGYSQLFTALYLIVFCEGCSVAKR